MTIRREDIDAGRIDFSDVAGTQRVPLTHPGTMLAKQYLKPHGITPYRLAKDIKVPLNRITAILAGKRAITPDTALRLARYLGTTLHSGPISSRTTILKPLVGETSTVSSPM